MTTESITLCHDCGQPVEQDTGVRVDGATYHTRCALHYSADLSEGEPPYYPLNECPGCGAREGEEHDVVCPKVSERGL